MKLLDRFPFTTVQALVIDAVAIYCVVADKVPVHTPEQFLQFFGGVAALHAGTAFIGKVRNDAGKGIRGDV